MASIFTFDPDPPRVASPWSTPGPGTPKGHLEAHLKTKSGQREGLNLTKLQAEPQEGPTEYKLHLLLRPRRSFTKTSTGRRIPGSYRTDNAVNAKSAPRRVSDSVLSGDGLIAPLTSASASLPNRQQRLVQLTTQLLWRLQQSSPYHASAATDLVLPQLPEVPSSQTVVPKLGNILPGLEESSGAIYEIGVSDDGTLVGLAEDELEESLDNLRAMAASLGCTVQVQFKKDVGNCEWYETVQADESTTRVLRSGKLWVAEALVKPVLHGTTGEQNTDDSLQHLRKTAQLRITLTGSTKSGKSSLLGSLTEATLDNGRGKSRSNVMKHRHELDSGMTSTVTPALLGYRSTASASSCDGVDIINYASDNVSSWMDIHQRAEGGRLVFFSDIAGHLKYLRTTVRGLVGWVPHWTLLCIPADSVVDLTHPRPHSREALAGPGADIHLSKNHLELCLKLKLPLVIVITKYDIASPDILRATVQHIRGIVQGAGRQLRFFVDKAINVTDIDLQSVPNKDIYSVEEPIEQLREDPTSMVPLLFTSVVKGNGITKLHAWLHELPITSQMRLRDKSPVPLFHVEDIYKVQEKKTVGSLASVPTAVIGGYLQCGSIHVGDELILGPYTTEPSLVGGSNDQSDNGSPPNGTSSRASNHTQASRSYPGALYRSVLEHHSQRSTVVWRRVKVISLRNLRLPVRTIYADQVATIGIDAVSANEPIISPSMTRIRKGMVLAGRTNGLPKATRTFTAFFEDHIKSLGIGSSVLVYVASVRASSRILSISQVEHDEADRTIDLQSSETDNTDSSMIETRKSGTRISFQILGAREFIAPGATILMMPGGPLPVSAAGKDKSKDKDKGERVVAGFEGFVGIVEDEDAIDV